MTQDDNGDDMKRFLIGDKVVAMGQNGIIELISGKKLFLGALDQTFINGTLHIIAHRSNCWLTKEFKAHNMARRMKKNAYAKIGDIGESF